MRGCTWACTCRRRTSRRYRSSYDRTWSFRRYISRRWGQCTSVRSGTAGRRPEMHPRRCCSDRRSGSCGSSWGHTPVGDRRGCTGSRRCACRSARSHMPGRTQVSDRRTYCSDRRPDRFGSSSGHTPWADQTGCRRSRRCECTSGRCHTLACTPGPDPCRHFPARRSGRRDSSWVRTPWDGRRRCRCRRWETCTTAQHRRPVCKWEADRHTHCWRRTPDRRGSSWVRISWGAPNRRGRRGWCRSGRPRT
jgi:hypothetical protein